MKPRWIDRGAALALMCCAATAVADNPYLPVEGNPHFQSALQGVKPAAVTVRGFQLQRHPVTNGEFLSFVKAYPEWRRDVVPPLFAGADYLGQWLAPAELGATAQPQQPVTRISWFAAEAYCEAEGARLPTWYEWELAAAASRTERDARADPAWRQALLDWYARPAGKDLRPVEQSATDVYGLFDLHDLVWEWVQDANSLMSSDEAQKFCGSGALSLQQKENFAVLMRVAMLSSLKPNDTTRSLGFRCAKDLPATGQ
ncbi:formylglycine-generating enzyme family protein [Nevskia soli]|uniref:formylglycine-generating enzyme family protein n=1 Tax=Nevskia soli TaxID=418856 RepID=UPI0004A71D48|nr:formylglycine-generating enzyme family protein [Nevskia soli]